MEALLGNKGDGSNTEGIGTEIDKTNQTKPSALDLITANFDFVQEQYREDYEKQDLIGYDDALKCLDQFVSDNDKKKDAHLD